MPPSRRSRKTRIKFPHKEIDAVVRLAIEAGWTVRKHRGHAVCYSPCGKHIVTVSISPSDGTRACKKIRSDFRKAGLDV